MERVPFNVGKNMLTPANGEASAVMHKLKIGETVAVEIYRERDNVFANHVQLVFLAIARALDGRVRNVRGWLAAQTGRADAVTINGKMVLVPWGTGPRDMRGEEFEAFWIDAREIIESDILPGLDDNAARDIEQLVRGLM
jgi:hypothetical protein